MSMKVKEYNYIAEEIFAPLYPVVAKQLIAESKVDKGKCIDFGCGPGHIGLTIAQLSDFNVTLIDKEEEMLQIANKNIQTRLLEERVQTIAADVENLPLENNTVQLAVSRGSMFFWDNKIKAFEEIYRVLAPNGVACIGGGFGTEQILEKIKIDMAHHNPKWESQLNERLRPEAVAKWDDIMKETNIPRYRVDYNSAGMWIVIEK